MYEPGQTAPEWVPMSWLADGSFSNETGLGNRRVRTHQDAPALGDIYKKITGKTL